MRLVRWIADISRRERRGSADIRRMSGVYNTKVEAREIRMRYFDQRGVN